MEKLKMKSQDLSQEHVAEIRQLFPDAVTEVKENGNIKLKVDFNVLKQELSDSLIDDKQERYQVTWPGKKEAILLSNCPTKMTLRPLIEKSVKFDSTKNLYIEGDNLEVLKALRETYLGKIKMIYIDPPYNTGNDFVYNDDFSVDKSDFLKSSGAVGDEGERLVLNTAANGRFHSNWLNMMYPRLKISRDLLSENGAIFVSIDDNEQANAVKLLDEIFGENNKVAEFVVIRSEGGGMAKEVIKGHDYLFVYAKDITHFVPLGKPKDIRGKIVERNGEKYWIQEDWLRKEFGKYGNCHYEEILNCKGQEKLNEVNEGLKNGQYVLLPKSNGMNIVGKLRSVKEDSSKFYSILKHLSSDGVKDLAKLGLDQYFNYPKPVSLLTEIIQGMTLFTCKDNDIIMDFFSGSATTAEAVMRLNKEDHGNRRFLLIQLPELLKADSKAEKDGYKTICDIGEERIRRVGNQLVNDANLLNQKDNWSNLDVGFRVFCLDSSNMKDVYYSPADIKTNLLDNLESNIKDDRSSLDILIQCMLSLGIPLDSTIKKEVITDKTCYVINDNDLVCCFDKNISETIIKQLADIHPLYACFKDSSFENDAASVNCEQIFKTISPTTKIRVI